MKKITRKDIERLITECRLTSCLECGKCTANCPLSEVFGEVPEGPMGSDVTYGRTPRGIIEKALVDADLVTNDAIWFCLTCDVCTEGCPSGVKFRDFIQALRKLVMDAGHDQWGVKCRRCGKYFQPDLIHKHILKKLSVNEEPPDFLFMCPRCRTLSFSIRAKKSFPTW